MKTFASLSPRGLSFLKVSGNRGLHPKPGEMNPILGDSEDMLSYFKCWLCSMDKISTLPRCEATIAAVTPFLSCERHKLQGAKPAPTAAIRFFWSNTNSLQSAAQCCIAHKPACVPQS